MEKYQVVWELLKGILSAVILIGGALAVISKYNPVSGQNKRIKELEKKVDENKFRITALENNVGDHQRIFYDSQYIMLKSLKALLDHAINPQASSIEKAANELEDYLLKK